MSPSTLKEVPLLFYILLLLAGLFCFGLIYIISLNRKLHSLIKRHKNLLQITGSTDMDAVCDHLAVRLERVEKKMDSVAQAYTVMAEDELSHLRTARLTRYNAFARQGGEQSFSIAMLDAKRNGIVLTSIFGSLENRVYAKPISDGTSIIPLSPEEINVLNEALKT